VGMQSRRHLAAIDGASGRLTAWNPGAKGSVSALAVHGGTVYAGGGFSAVGGQRRGRLAAIDGVTGAVKPWHPEVRSRVAALAIAGGTLYAGGRFSAADGRPRRGLAAYSLASGRLTRWRASGSDGVAALAAARGRVFVASTSIPKGVLSAFDARSGRRLWRVGSESPLAALALGPRALFAGGGVHELGGRVRDGLFALDPRSGRVTSWRAGSKGEADSLAYSAGVVYAAGQFGNDRVAAFDAGSGSTLWIADSAFDTYPVAIAAAGGTVFAEGAPRS